MLLTAHATRRSHQRSIPRNVIELIAHYGEECRVIGAANKYILNRNSIDLLADGDEKVRGQISHYTDGYLVIGSKG